MGAQAEVRSEREILISPARNWHSPTDRLDCGNSGTTMRLLAGLIASRPIEATLVGDASLSQRPMRRITEPLRRMGALVEGDRPPLYIRGGNLIGIDHFSAVASAQVKSCLLLAGLRAEGTTSVTEPWCSRNHTETMLRSAGAEVGQSDGPAGHRVWVEGGARLAPLDIDIPADISSAAFLMVAATLVTGSEVVLTGVGLNPTRSGILDVLDQAGARYEVAHLRESGGEAIGDIRLWSTSPLRPFVIEGELVPRLIDEIPVLAVLATQCQGTTEIRDAAELRVKESDRIEEVAAGLRAMGANVEPTEDGLVVSGPSRLGGARIAADGDHRIAMAFAIAGLVAEGETEIEGAESIRTSYPAFEADLASLMPV
jgi:3-phosphoshikimate 1-carboxyvinyltransferase